jgi:hypothetical protein
MQKKVKIGKNFQKKHEFPAKFSRAYRKYPKFCLVGVIFLNLVFAPCA